MQDTSYKFGLSLVKKEVIPFSMLEKAMKIRQTDDPTNPRSIANILVENLGVNYDTIYSELAQLYGFKKMKLADENIDENTITVIKKIMESIPEKLLERMEKNKILPMRNSNEQSQAKFTLVAVNPTDRDIAKIARAIGAGRYEVLYISPEDYKELHEMVFPPQNEYLKQLEDSNLELDTESVEEEAVDEQALDSEVNRSLLVNLVEAMLIEGVRRGASDIHVIPRGSTTTEIFFRIDGKLQIWHRQNDVRPEALSAVVKDRTLNVDRFERESSQDGFIQRSIDDHIIRYRVSVVPIVGREFQFKLESIVIRILDDRKVITDFEKLGFTAKAKEFFVKAISKPQGMVIVTGPTGSGKSTTLIAALSYIIDPSINVLTVEDPVEYVINGVRQLKISQKNNFDQALRAILRHDPDVVMVGEIRDKKTAETGIKLANTGHLTFSTLHTNDAPSAVSRLYKMGVETFLIAYAINIIIAQRLMRRVCDKCRQPLRYVNPKMVKNLGFSDEEIEKTTFYNAVGCEHCTNGYKGRVAIHETLYFSKEIRQLIFETGSDINEEAIRAQAVKDGMKTLRGAARDRVMAGITTLEELAQVTSED